MPLPDTKEICFTEQLLSPFLNFKKTIEVLKEKKSLYLDLN